MDPPTDPVDCPPPPLRITQLTVERVVNLGNYENKRLAATATVAAGDDPATVADALRAFVAAQLGLTPRPAPPPSVPAPAKRVGAPPDDDDDAMPF